METLVGSPARRSRWRAGSSRRRWRSRGRSIVGDNSNSRSVGPSLLSGLLSPFFEWAFARPVRGVAAVVARSGRGVRSAVATTTSTTSTASSIIATSTIATTSTAISAVLVGVDGADARRLFASSRTRCGNVSKERLVVVDTGGDEILRVGVERSERDRDGVVHNEDGLDVSKLSCDVCRKSAAARRVRAG